MAGVLRDARGVRRGADDDRPSIEATLTRRDTLAEHLEWQIRLSDFGEDEVGPHAPFLGRGAVEPLVTGVLSENSVAAQEPGRRGRHVKLRPHGL